MKYLSIFLILVSCSTNQLKQEVVTISEEAYFDKINVIINNEPDKIISLVKYSEIFKINMSVLDSVHVNKDFANENIEKNLVSNYLNLLDSRKLIFTKEDLITLSLNHSNKNIIKTNGIALVSDVYDLYRARVKEYEIHLRDFSFKESELKETYELNVDRHHSSFESSKFKLIKKWENAFIYDVFQKEIEKKISHITSVNDRKNAVKNISESLLNTSVADFFECFIDSFSQLYDPHSHYLSPIEAKAFNSDIKGELEGIGAVLDWDDASGYLRIAEVIPDGGLSLVKEIKVNDLFTRVREISTNEEINLKGITPNKSKKFFLGKAGTKIEVSVLHQDGKTSKRIITRKLIKEKSSFSQSLVIQKNGVKIGYIFLPKFYRDFSNTTSRNCTDDIIKSIIDLRKKNISSLIIDLRNNSGGSLLDAQLISSVFIEGGPVLQLKDESSNISFLNYNKQIIYYKDPLVIMVNKQSASASEILASTLQDYNRALIIGSTTHGKGSVQGLLDYSDYFKSFDYPDSLLNTIGTLKFSMQKFYRITGQTTQQVGVIPDIVLPDVKAFYGFYEKEIPFSLKSDTIPSLIFTPYDFKKEDIINRSSVRTNNSKELKSLDINISKIKELYSSKTIDLNKESISRINTQIEALKKELSSTETINSFTLTPLSYFNSKNLKELKKDIVFDEALNISMDLINKIK